MRLILLGILVPMISPLSFAQSLGDQAKEELQQQHIRTDQLEIESSDDLIAVPKKRLRKLPKLAEKELKKAAELLPVPLSQGADRKVGLAIFSLLFGIGMLAVIIAIDAGLFIKLFFGFWSALFVIVGIALLAAPG